MKEEEIRIPYPERMLYPVLKQDNGSQIPVPVLLAIDPDDIDGEYQMQSSWFATVAYQTMMREIEIERKERQIKELEAKTYKTLITNCQKKPSESALRAAISTTAAVVVAYEDLYVLKKDHAAWDAVRQGLAQKKEMLINMGASLRLDKKSSLS